MKTLSEVRASKRVDLASAVPLARPFTVFIEPTNVCNFACKMCPETFADYAEKAGYYQRMPDVVYSKVLDDLAELRPIVAVKFYLEGEPLLNPRLPDMVREIHAREISDRTEVVTNGSMLTEERAGALIASGLRYLTVSIYGIGEEHAGVTGNKITPGEIRENVRGLVRLRNARGMTTPVVRAQFLPSRSGEEHNFREFYRDVVDDLALNPRHNWNGSDERSRELVHIAPTPFSRQVCPEPFYTLTVKANGDVTPCCVDWSGRLRLGNVMQATLRELWEGDELRRIQQAHASRRRGELGACANCAAIYTFPDSMETLTGEEFARRTRA